MLTLESSNVPRSTTVQCTMCPDKYLPGGSEEWTKRICVTSNIDPFNYGTGGGDSGGRFYN